MDAFNFIRIIYEKQKYSPQQQISFYIIHQPEVIVFYISEYINALQRHNSGNYPSHTHTSCFNRKNERFLSARMSERLLALLCDPVLLYLLIYINHAPFTAAAWMMLAFLSHRHKHSTHASLCLPTKTRALTHTHINRTIDRFVCVCVCVVNH